MTRISKIAAISAILAVSVPALAQDDNDGPLKAYSFQLVPPEPLSVPASGTAITPIEPGVAFTLTKNVKWTKGDFPGEQRALLFGDPNKPGEYGVLTRWEAGANSKPHINSADLRVYVLSGTWWVSTSNQYDRTKMFPIPAGSFALDQANQVHWEGAKEGTGTAVTLTVGIGPIKTIRLGAP